MRKTVLFSYLIFFLLAQAWSQNIQVLSPMLERLHPEKIFPLQPENGYFFNGKTIDGGPSPSFTAATINNTIVFTAESPSAKNADGIQASWKSNGNVKQGDVLLARLSIRAIYAKQESGEAVVNFFVQQAVAPFERIINLALNVGPEWKIFDIPFIATNNMLSGEAFIGFNFGALAPKVEITNVQVFNFQQKADLSKMPATKFSYIGREKDAAWRREALDRIEKIRTAPLVVQVSDAKGKPINGVSIQAKLVDQAFIFGTAASVNEIVGNDSDAIKYKNYLLQFFNAVSIDNNLKWPEWRDLKKREKTKAAIQWITGNGLRLRGHNLVWPGRKFAPAIFGKQADFGPSFADSINSHIKDIVSFTKGKVYGWDVINEMLHEQDYFKVMPRSQAVEWFKLAKQTDPDALLFINEYSMLNNVASPKNIQEYLGVIAELRNGGAPIDAIGVQGHVGRQPRSPLQVLTDLDLFTPTGLPVQITEFDFNTPDEDLQADYTRDFLIACYSHPNITGFTMWGFWEAAHWKPDAALFKKDWRAKPNSAVWEELVTKQWKTNITQRTDATGTMRTRGHFGKYEITAILGNKVVRSFYQLVKDGQPISIKM